SRSDRAERRPSDPPHHGEQPRRSSGAGRIALSLLRGEPLAGLRSHGGLRHALEHRGRHGRALRAGRHARGGARRARRQAGSVRTESARRRPAGRGAREGGSAGGGRRVREGGAMKIDRRTYADHYGPTTGDRIRLADTDLIVQIEQDATVYGDEAKFGGGK